MKGLIKSLFGLFIVGFGIINFSYGILNIPDCFHYNVYGTEEYRPCQELDIDEDYTLGNSVFHLADFFDFDNLDGYKYIGGNFHTTSYYYMFWSGSELINISSSTWNGRKYIGSPKFCYYSGTDYFGLFQKCGQHGIGTKGLYYDNYLYSFDNIYDIFNGVNVSRYYINNMNYPNAGGSSYSPISVCGVYEDIGQSFCIPFLDVSDFGYDGRYIEQHYEYINYTEGGSSASDVLGYIDYMTNSPLMSSGGGGNGGGLNEDSEKIFYSDNNKVYFDTFNAIGYNTGLCFSNFNIDDLIDSGTYYSDLFPRSYFTGASVLDLYEDFKSSTSSYNPFKAWYNWYFARYNQLNSSTFDVVHDPVVYSFYGGVPKGNFYIFEKLNSSSFIESYNFSPIDYYTYCNMALSGFDPDGLFTGDTSNSFDNIFINPCIRDGTCISDNGQFILSGANDLGYFSDDADIVDVFNSIYSQFKYAFKVDSSLTGITGLLPNYIIFGFFLFLLLYLLKR